MDTQITQKDDMINIINSQTDYDSEKAELKLKEWNNDFIKVIKEFLNPNFLEKEKKEKKEKNKIVSVNQTIMKQLREFKDKQNKNHDYIKKYKDYLNKKQEVMQLNENLKQQEALRQKFISSNNHNEKPNTDPSNNKVEEIFL